MSVVDRTFGFIDRGRSDDILVIPTGLEKYDECVCGTMQGMYYLYGAETAVGKTSFARDKHVHVPYEYFLSVNNSEQLDVLFVDFTLEITPEFNMLALLSRRLFLDHHLAVSVRRLMHRLPDDLYRLVLSYKPYLQTFSRKLLTFSEELTPGRYHNILFEIAKRHGTFENPGAKLISEAGHYTPHNRNLFVIILVDTVNLAEVDSGHETTKSTIDRISRISVWFRNKCSFTPIIIQQFNAEISAVDRNRYGIKTPLLRDFEDSKRPVKDADVVCGLYEPARHLRLDDVMFRGYDISHLRSWFRSLHLLKHRQGESNRFVPMKFDGAVGIFSQLPAADQMSPVDYELATKH